MKELIDILHNEELTLIVKSKDGTLHRFGGRGVKDLLTLVTKHPEVLHEALIADKVVGKAAAACMIAGGAKQIYADVISKPALALLQRHDVIIQYGQLANHIINRAGNGWCPMELLSLEIDNPLEIIDKIKDHIIIH